MLVFGGVHVFGVSWDLDWFYHDWSKRETRGPISPVARFLSFGVGVHFILDDWTRTRRFCWSFFLGRHQHQREYPCFFPAILGIFNVFLETTKHFHNKCSLVFPKDLSLKNSWRLFIEGNRANVIRLRMRQCTCMGILSDSPLTMHWIWMLTLK